MDPLPNLLHQMCQEIRKDHKVHPVQQILNQISFLGFEENSPFQEAIISESCQRPVKSFFQNPKRLNDLVNTSYLNQKFLLSQADIDKILKVIQKKFLRDTHLLVEIKRDSGQTFKQFPFQRHLSIFGTK